MANMPEFTVSDVTKIVGSAGWENTKTCGGHEHYTHPTLPGRVTIAQHGSNATLPPKTIESIMKQAHLEEDYTLLRKGKIGGGKAPVKSFTKHVKKYAP